MEKEEYNTIKQTYEHMLICLKGGETLWKKRVKLLKVAIVI